MTPLIQKSGVLPSGVLPLRAERFERAPWIELGWPGLDPVHLCLDIFLFDDSGSITAPVGADPVGNRYLEAKRALQLVSSWSHSGRSKVAVRHFDHPHGMSPTVALNDLHLARKLGPQLRAVNAFGTSDLGPSLTDAERLAAEHADHDVRLTVFSDFEITDQDPAQVLSRLVSFPGRVHAIVLGGDAPLDLDGADNITVTPLREEDPPGAFAAALHRSLTATRRAARYCVLHTPSGVRQLA